MNAIGTQDAISRRSFLKVTLLASGALLVGVGCEDPTQINELKDGIWTANLYVRINADGTVTIDGRRFEVASFYRSLQTLRQVGPKSGPFGR